MCLALYARGNFKNTHTNEEKVAPYLDGTLMGVFKGIGLSSLIRIQFLRGVPSILCIPDIHCFKVDLCTPRIFYGEAFYVA